ncbi:hypothetical protein Q5W88_16335 [Shouchella clausii]|uniref:CD3337/EF1877 family mobilome membrane protein n=1 Tax=Shouchella clausii TaxID=79880 RepID=UPI0026F44CF6|nr:hypothetical protein [Shouchella clausii]MDO7284690.1 hypothetical protein [Shouchella clausii]MDO7304785.1 hypothetical protein [Shouchella clausii]
MIWKKVAAVTLSVLCVLIFTFPVYADEENENMTEPKVVDEGGVELSSKRFPIARYMANNEDADAPIKGAFVGLSNAIFSLSGYVVLLVDTSMEKLYSLEPIDKFADTLTNVSTTVYNTLKRHFGQMLFIFAIGYMIYLSVVRQSVKEAMRRAFLFLMVLVVGGYWMMNAGYFMKTLNSLSTEAHGYLLNAGNGLIKIADGEGVYADTNNIDKDNLLNGTVAVMRNVYFDLALKKPYLIVNYGETSENKINNNDPDAEDLPGGTSYTRVDRLLAFDLTSDGEKERKKTVKKEVSDYNNENMGSGSVFSQMGQAFISLLGAIFLGIPFVLMALFNFILQLLALGLAFVLPFVFILSYIPHFAYSGFVTIGKLLSVFVLKAMLGILVCFVYVLCFIVDVLLPPTDFAMYLTNLVVLLVVLLIMIVKRDAIVKLVTAGRVQNFDGNLMNNVKNSVVNPALRGLGAVNPALAAAMHKVGGLRESPTPEAQSPAGSPVKASPPSDLKEERTPQTTENNNETPSNVAKMDERRKEKRNAQKANVKDGKKNGQIPIDKKQTGKQSDKDKETNQLMPVAVTDKERQFDGDNTPENSERKTQAEALLEKKQLENAEERNKQFEAVDKADRIPESQQQSLTASVRTKQENQNETDVNNYEELKPIEKDERIHKNEGGEKENDVRTNQREAIALNKPVDSISPDNEHLRQVEKPESKSHLVKQGGEENGVRNNQTEAIGSENVDNGFSRISDNEHLRQIERVESKTHYTKPTLQEGRSSQLDSVESHKEVTNKKESPLSQQRNESVEKQRREVPTKQPAKATSSQTKSRVNQEPIEKGKERMKKELEAVEKEENRNS